MKRLKQIVGLMLAGFLLFAPPGTLVVGSLLVLGLLGRTWFIAIALIGALVLAFWFVRRKSIRASSLDKT